MLTPAALPVDGESIPVPAPVAWHVVRCLKCRELIYYRGGTMAALRCHMSWAHPVYKTRLQSIQETGRRPGRGRWWQWWTL